MDAMLNLGCGFTYHPAWTNVDMFAAGPRVIVCDLRGRLPFASASYDVVYHSHVLEHFAREEGEAFMREAIRVLKPGGVMRVAVPDLERIAVLYLEKLAAAVAGERGAGDDYEWMTLELLDQMVRERGGGRMREYLARMPLNNAAFVRGRIGAELDAIRDAAPPSWREQLRRKGARGFVGAMRKRAARLAASLIGGAAARRRYDYGTLRDRGELHKWMYDRYSLPRLMTRLGLGAVACCDAFTSNISGFDAYGLDVRDGQPRKPDSLFVEGVKIG